MLIQALAFSLRDLRIPSLLKIFLLCMALNALTLTLLIGGANYLIFTSHLFDDAWLELFGDVAAMVFSVAAAWMLFPLILPFIMSFFDEAMAERIEAYDYPNGPKPPERPFYAYIWHDLRFSLWAVFLNVLVSPLYLIPVFQFLVYFALNGYLLGAQFFEMAAGRHIGKPEARALRKRHGMSVFLGGVFVAFMATVPFVNLLSPFWGVAAMVHLYHGIVGTPRVSRSS